MSDRMQLSNHQLAQYFDRVRLPDECRKFSISDLSDRKKLSYLERLHKHHLCTVPWENLTQHYSWHRTINVAPQHLFDKIVQSTTTGQAQSPASGFHGTNRGGFCMEVNFFQHILLTSIGFDSYIVGSRTCHNGVYGGWTHCVNIVRIAETKYMLDGGYGSRGPSYPIPLQHGASHPHVRSGGEAECRLTFERLAQHSSHESRVWVYQFRSTPGNAWTPCYCFVDVEFIAPDIRSMNFAPWLDFQSPFTHKVMAVRFSTTAETDAPYRLGGVAPVNDGEIDGALTLLQSLLKWRRKGVTVLRKELRTEGERLDALKDYFGITLPKCDMEAILGSAAAISNDDLNL
ncbi:hypothetical protein Q7P35_008234 [Cladosporium inversicolor]